MGLFTSIINNQYRTRGSFWGDYEYLNAYNEGKTDSMIFNYQMTKLKTLLSHPKKVYDASEAFILQSEFSLQKMNDFYNSQQLDKNLLEKIMDIFNAPLVKSKVYKNQNQLDSERLLNDINMVRAELQKKGAISLSTLDKVEAWAKQNQIKYSGGIKAYQQEKADEAESLVANIIQNSEIYKNYKAIVTGQLRDKNGQIIQDVMTISEDVLSKPLTGKIYYTKDKQKNYINTLQDLLDEMARLPLNEQITLSDELYKALEVASSLSIQVKSGISQPIITRAIKDNIPLSKLNTSTAIFQDLWEIQNVGNYFKSSFTSPELTSLANYNLAHIMGDLLHVSKLKNQMLFTEKGFETPYEWMVRHKGVIKLKDDIKTIGADFLTRNRAYRLRMLKGNLT